MRMKLFAAALLIVAMAGPAYPQRKETLQLQADMIDLKNRVNELQTSVDRNDAALKSLVEKMSDQVNSLAGGIQKITQAVDTVKTQGDKSSSELRVILTSSTTTGTTSKKDCPPFGHRLGRSHNRAGERGQRPNRWPARMTTGQVA